MDIFEQLKHSLVVSCQALEDEPLHSSFIMGRMAKAATEGGAAGIRANGVEDIKEIKQQTDLPVIGIIKQDYDDSEVFITPTIREVELLAETGVEMVAMDGTVRPRPNGEKLEEIVRTIKEKYPDVKLMADVSTIEEAELAEKIGFDCAATTLVGYTKETKGATAADNDFYLLKKMVEAISIPVVAEGQINDPQTARQAIDSGAYFVVVGSAITRPQLITKKFADAVYKKE